MAEGEREKEYDTRKAIEELQEQFHTLNTILKDSPISPLEASLHYCQEFCKVLVEHAGRWKTDEDPLPLLEVYMLAIFSYAKATPCLSSECENVPLVLEKLALNCVELLLSLPGHVPGALWEEFQSSVKMAHSLLQESGSMQLHMLSALAQEHGVWSNTTLSSILSNEMPEMDRIHGYLDLEGPALLNMRIKHLMKDSHIEKAAVLAKVCSEYPGYEGKGNFKQTYLVCICLMKAPEQLVDEITQVDCKDALEMICNLESEGEEKAALCLCSAFLKKQLLQGDVYCAWELTLFWSKLVMRVESSTEAFLAQCRNMALLSRSVCHILFLIKVIQSEVEGTGLPACIEMCIQALQMASSDNTDSKVTICKTISCLLPVDLEVKRACQLTEFLLQPTVDSYYAVESLYNEPDQKLEQEENLPVPNSLRCELLLALKTQWPFDPEFWDWRTLKRNCLSLMGDEASIVSSIDTLNDTDDYETEVLETAPEFTDLQDFLMNTTNELNEITDEKEKNREAKKLREQGFVSARFRNWQAYMQYCVLCDKEFLGHRIVRHAQKHFKDGVYMCPICADSFETREVLDPHVASHVKQSCKERLAAMKAQSKIRKPPQSPGSQSKSLKDTVLKVEASSSDGNHTSADTSIHSSPPKPSQLKCEQEFTDDCSCPVTNCNKVFKFFRHLMCHVRAHKDDEEATRFLELQKQKVVCQYCRRHFVNVKHLNDHLQMHCGTKPYYCIQLDCTANFSSNSELLMHRRLHTEFKAQCMFPNCGKVFNEAYLLYDHEAQHYLTYTCRMAHCGKTFDSQVQFKQHQESHGPNDAIMSSENNLQPKMEQSNQYTPRKEGKCSAFVRLERINAQDYMKDVALKSATSSPPQDPKEPGPVRVKHSIENMLNCAMSPTKEPPHKCYTPLTPPPALQLGNEKIATYVPPLQHDGMAANGENPMYPCTAKPVKVGLEEEAGNQVPPVYQKKISQIFPTPEIKSENPFSLVGYPATPAVASSDENAHSCPFEDCTRSYSTNKSLSRHVKKIHPDIFEEWKLAKKYNKVVKITAKKNSSKSLAVKSPCQEDRAQHHLSPVCNNTGLQQMEYPIACSSSPSPCYPVSTDPVPITPMMNHSMYPQWGNPQIPIGAMQADMSQTWSPSSMNNCYAGAYHLNEYPSRSSNHWQSDLYQPPAGHPSERDKEHLLAAIHGGTIPLVSSEPSLMNEMSQYVSSSLMLDNGVQMHNGGQQYGMIHPEVHPDSVDTSLIRKSNVNMTDQLGNGSITAVESMPGGSYNLSYVPNEPSSLSPRPTVDIPSKEIGIDSQITPHGTMEITNTENLTPSFQHQMESSAEGLLSPPVQTDVPYEEDVESEATPSEEKTGDGEVQKGKRCRQSKRTKWPAIIKDGKVICRRCFREFSSTKSLGGHLSKRSQCKPLDEVDLSADLPTSFLDFLNDPHVPDTNGAIYNMSNGDFPQESVSIPTPQPSETNQQETQNPQDSHPSSGGHTSHTIESNESLAVNTLTDKSSNVACPESNVIQIQGAFQRLDPVEADHEKMMQKSLTEQTLTCIDAENDQSVTPKMKVKKEVEHRNKGPKPFKCEQDNCEYGFMTKEALFKHLSKMHDYSNEMIEELKKTPVKLAPYTCQICPKTFTRTTGLRIHYENVHRLSKEEMLKLKVGVRKKRTSNPSTDTEPECSRISHGNGTSVGSAIVKQEPLDVAIGGMESTDQERSSKAPEDIIAENAKQDPAPQVTIKQVQPQESRPMNSDWLSSELPSQTGHTPRGLTEAVQQADPTPQVKQTLNKITIIADCEIQSDALAPGQTTEALSSQQDQKLGSEKPSSSKSTPSNDKGQVQKREKSKKRIGLKMCDADNSFSPYRPYRCVHEGCSAAFTIQQNLILHYRAMHQSSLPQGELGAETAGAASGQDTEVNESEVRCQVKDCSRIFQGITRLIQHYLLLHKFTRDKATAMMSSMKVGTFQCDRSQCTLSFDSVDKYIEHIKNFHKEINISESGTVDQTFKCEHEGCDRVYTTRSNLLRHLMKKHDFVCDTKPQQVKTTAVSPNNGKENIENKFKLKKKILKKKDGRTPEHWTSFGKPTLKSHEEASAMCTKKSSLQYPCMIKGCDAVERAERNIFRHYTTHGLTERYIEDQRSQFIFCKKLSRSRFKDANKSEGMSTSSSSEQSGPDESDAESSQVSSQGQETLEGVIQDEAKISNDESSESSASTGEEKKRRGRPRKSEQKPACTERRSTLRTRSIAMSENADPGAAGPLEEQPEHGESVKPLEFEKSFLQFLDKTESPDTPKRKMTEGFATELPIKRQRTLQQKTVNIIGKIPDDDFKSCQNLVDFRNPLNLKSVKNVKIVMDKTFSDGADLLLKQLQDMRPMVIIKKCLYS